MGLSWICPDRSWDFPAAVPMEQIAVLLDMSYEQVGRKKEDHEMEALLSYKHKKVYKRGLRIRK